MDLHGVSRIGRRATVGVTTARGRHGGSGARLTGGTDRRLRGAAQGGVATGHCARARTDALSVGQVAPGEAALPRRIVR